MTLYGLALLAIRVLGFGLDAYARHAHPYEEKEEGEDLEGAQREFRPVVIGYLIAIGTGLLLPYVAIALYFGIAVYLIVPFREAARLLIRRHGESVRKK